MGTERLTRRDRECPDDAEALGKCIEGKKRMNDNRTRVRLMEVEAYCRELESKNAMLRERLKAECAARRNADIACRMAYIAAGVVVFACYALSFASMITV